MKRHLILFFIAAVVSTLYLSTKPIFGWDTLPYMGIVLSYEGHEPKEVHRLVYQLARRDMPTEAFSGLVSGSDYRVQCYREAAFFTNELTFYRVKPLYTGLIFGLYQLGFPLVKACFIPGYLAYLVILCLSFLWGGALGGVRRAWAFGLLVLLFPPLLDLCRDPTPNSLSTLFLFAALYLYTVQKSRHGVWAFLVLAVLTRIDHLIFALVFFLFEKLDPRSNLGSISFPQTMVMVAALLAVAFGLLLIPTLLGNELFWFGKFSHMQSVNNYVQAIPIALHNMVFSFFPLLFGISITQFRQIRPGLQSIILLSVLVLFIRLILFPSFQERFVVHFELIYILALVSLPVPKATVNSDKLNL